jgi:predicted membrane protein
VKNVDASRTGLPSHIEDTVRSLAQLHAEHHQNATRHDRVVEGATAVLAHPWFMIGMGFIAGWVSVSLAAPTCLSIPGLRLAGRDGNSGSTLYGRARSHGAAAR